MNTKRGFSLIELMVSIAIVGILTSIAYPIYAGYLNESRRAQAQQNLLLLSQKMALFHARNQSYAGVTLQSVAPSNISHNQYYKYSITELTEQSYLLSATPVGSDNKCGTLTLDQLGENNSHGKAKNSECWLQ